MTQQLSEDLRNFVASRSDFLCEYCLIHQDDTLFGCQIVRIVSIKDGGNCEAENLAFACTFCNRSKGTDPRTLLGRTGELVRFFNPRQDTWHEHFYIEGFQIKPKTHTGEVTVEVLKFNSTERVLERSALCESGRYPVATALARMKTK